MKLLTSLVLAGILCVAGSARAQSSAPPASNMTTSDQAHLATSLETFLRFLFGWGPDYQVKIGPFKDATIPDFYEVGIEVKYKDQSQSGVVYASKDGKYVIRGELYKTTDNPFAETRKELAAGNSPSKGPADAKVTFVEFSDFECPHCRLLHQYLPTLEQKYPQVRVVFKNFPIENLHPWAMTAAIAGHCASQVSNDAFWKMESTIFDQQDLISAENAYDKLTDAAVAAGLQRDSFRACLADPASKDAIAADVALGQKLGVNSTPSIFIDGRQVVGGDPDSIDQIINFELHRTP